MALDETLRRLLEDVMSRRAPRLRHLLDPDRATDAELDDACQVLTEEFVEAGFGSDGEPTERGRLLERLIDEVARPLMRRSRAR
ncbi:MAG TPA: hypothetical protein VFI16_00195 [Anaeromyxobacteraceae bacterium]|nr:hypothetical protein [Anaeromyxobacteraceae bacterium]